MALEYFCAIQSLKLLYSMLIKMYSLLSGFVMKDNLKMIRFGSKFKSINNN